MKKLPCLVAFAGVLVAGGAQAFDAPSTVFVAGAASAHGTHSVAAGVAWPWAWQRASHGGEWTGMTEVFVSPWSSKVAGGGRESLTQVGVLPVVRYRFDHGRSDWFVEGGIGASYLDRLYRRDDKQFATRFNFHDVIGVGLSFGAHREHELGLRAVHVSNAGIKEPNPGENFLQLRYARQF